MPRTFKQAEKSEKWGEWKKAMEREIETMKERKVWHLEALPDGVKPVGCRWVYTIKRDDLGKIIRYKARLVAQGYKQVKGETYDETFSPVVNFSVIRFFFSLLVSCKGWYHIQCDVTGAYLYAPLKEKIFMIQPPGFCTKGKENLFCRLDKALYGLHQSGRMWFYELNKVLLNIGFIKLDNCNCVYTLKSNIVLVVYVDDIVVFGKSKIVMDEAIHRLQVHFDLKIMGQTRKLLGVEFEDDETGLYIHQKMYIEEICERFKKFKFPVSSLPISKGIVYSKSTCPQTEAEILEMIKFPYRSILGCLSFISNKTRPDISYAVNIFSQFQNNYGLDHWSGLLKLLGYLLYTKDFKMKLNCNQTNLVAYSDSDFAANRDDRTSMGGEIILLGNSPITWRTFKEKCISLSTMEAEFVAMTEVSKELLWFDRILAECFDKKIVSGYKNISNLLSDNQAAIDFVKSPIENCRSRHIDVKLFFIRDLVFENKFTLKFVRSKENLADVFTKPLTKHDLRKFLDNIFSFKL